MSNVTLRSANQVGEHEFSKDELDLIKSTVAKGATDNELKLFLYRCKNMGLDPLKPGMVHFVKYNNSPGTIIVGIEGFRARAARTGQHAGTSRGVIRDESGKCIGAWCEVRRHDWTHPAREEVSLAEYTTGKAMWAKMPETMIRKVAEVAALRMAFPEELGGVYAEEEIQQANVRDVHTQALTAKVQNTDEAPEFEAADYFAADPVPVALGLGEYKINIGKKYKGRALSTIKRSELEGYAEWLNAQNSTHADVVACVNAIHAYLEFPEEPA
jgi:phage recombination protein Bet